MNNYRWPDQPDTFEIAKANANPECNLCFGTGAWSYDHNHSQPCPNCCVHGEWWELSEELHGRTGLCCGLGCGYIKGYDEW